MTLDRRFIELYDDYTHRPLARRVFLERLMLLAGSAAAAEAVLGVLEPNYARAAIVAPDDARIVTRRVTFDGPDGQVVGYEARPKDGTRNPTVIVIHENRGLNPHIEDVARHLATDGILAVAVDFLQPLGGTPADPDAARALFAKLTPDAVAAQARVVADALRKDPRGLGKVGAVGFCWGGGMVNQLATRPGIIDVGVAYYGMAPDTADVAKIKAPLVLHYAGLDTRVNASRPAYEEALKAANVPHSIYVYEGVDHAFNNDTSAERYNADAAKLAWGRTVDFFKQTLAS
ncbi:Carboxymethylenebutenolidase [Hyphomicrobiales bacterium]|nr:Carboxymethylenebutenolidase [Hyphomicrobiales bacterium]CAH1680897.1 Carboxymethylenebutenolidase [Hyphomicrobiales bacterium]